MITEFAHSLFEAIADSAILVDKNGRILDWNQGAVSAFGYHKKEALGRSVNLIFEQNQPFPKIIQEILPQQKKWSNEIRFIRKNGIKGFCKTNAILLNSIQNKTLALITCHIISSYKDTEKELNESVHTLSQEFQSIITSTHFLASFLIKNISTQDQLDKSLRESELRFRLLAENATDIISRHSPDGVYLYVSPTCKTLLGFSPDELIGRTAYKLVHYDDVSKLRKAFNRRKENPESHHTITYRIRRKEGDYRWFESNVRIIRDEDNKLIREIQTASRDVTDHILDKKARLRGQQLAHVFRLSSMEEMASGMAHEISQPLAAIVNYTQGCVRYLQSDDHDPDQLAEIMKKAVAQAERAGEVIHRLKNFFCKGQLFKTPCKINKLLRETVTLIKSDLDNSKTKIDFELAKNVLLISADKIQLQQVVLNLIQNAIEAMQETDFRSRRIRVRTKLFDSNNIEITVSDSGPGFSKEIIHKVFEPFFTTKAHGRGMGLAICRSIIEAHGGEFSIHPNSSNQSWIRFTLPIHQGE